MRPVLIVLIFIIVLIALIMAYLLIVSNTRSEKGGPTVFDMMMRNKEEPPREEEEGPSSLEKGADLSTAPEDGNASPSASEGSEDSPPTWEENRVDAAKQTGDAP